ncbi:MAG: G8 domain-containing protein [candidate division NC10 bacterium]|nr:G8 domain-containing protein [candidate division NC10 bacterium]
MDRLIKTVVVVALAAGTLLAEARPSEAKDAPVHPCGTGTMVWHAADKGDDVEITNSCTVLAGTYKYGNVNILNGGSLIFTDATIDFWAASILVENGGSLIAGTPSAPIGTNGGVVTIHLYGKDQGAGGSGILCKSPESATVGPCGVPLDVWNSNGGGQVMLPGGVTDFFYQYKSLPYDDGGNPAGYFGYKVLAVSYGGTLQLFGKKGAIYGTTVDSSDSGTSWVRLTKTLNPGDTTLVLDRAVDWTAGDQIVVTTTDYLPGHSEQLTIASVSGDRQTIIVQEKIAYIHNGVRFPLDEAHNPGITRVGLSSELTTNGAETRAAVALLTRSIRIVSEGDAPGAPFPDASTGYFFGGHTIVRQGFSTYQVQGVEFKQLGQGGRMAHYPVHFHLARKTPPSTFVMDSSVNESMTRWYVVHGTHGVTVARTVGYLSIGHGYYIEDGSEINNRFLSNIGIFARAAVDNPQNPRKVPGILASPDNPGVEMVPFHSDYDHPTVFWIMNGWNDFEYNMAAGAGACGACYWLVPGANSGPSRQMAWESYASMQTDISRAAMTPLKRFKGNYCSTAMNSFNTIGNTTACFGVGSGSPQLAPVSNPLAPSSQSAAADSYYPVVSQGGGRFATSCDTGDCSTVPKCAAGSEQNCMITALDRYTSSFHWTETNFAAIWLRPQWYLMTNSVLTDVQNGGLTIVTGGGYTASDVIPGHWALVRKNAFVGNTQKDNPYASNGSPFNPQGLRCDAPFGGNHCLSAAEGVSFPISNFGVNQRLFNIYDGPVYQDSNAYLDINPVHVDDCSPQGCVGVSLWLAGNALGLPQDSKGTCYMPNAAIGWKQPNGFYYPPAFHSTNLFFDDVDIRHFVIEPLFKPGTYTTDPDAVKKRYCNGNDEMFTGFTDVDRQTELSDDDGSLTGYVNTISVNLDPFFNAPVETIECASDVTAKTSPYDYVTSVVYPRCAVTNTCGTSWAVDCTSPSCYGVPLYRQLVTGPEQQSGAPYIRMAGQAVSQRSTLTANNGTYYIDTTVGMTKQQESGATNLNVFQAGGVYYPFLVFAKPTTIQTYQLYVGPGFNVTTDVWATQANIKMLPVQFTQVLWPSTWQRAYNQQTGILTVTMDMSFSDFQTLYAAGRQERCQPSSFCSWNSTANQCQCALSSGDDLYDVCSEKNAAGEDAVCAWAVKDVDCPTGGCFGFGVKLSSAFSTDPTPDPRPAATCFPNAVNQGWNVSFTPAASGLAGTCPTDPAPPAQFCQ